MADEELERRVERVERELDGDSGLPAEVRAAREDAAAARHLAASNDRDVADLHHDVRALRRATAQSFNGMRADLSELRTDVTQLREETRAGHGEIVAMLTTLIERDGPGDR